MFNKLTIGIVVLGLAAAAAQGQPASKPPAAALNPKVPKETRASLLAQYGDELAGAGNDAEAAAAYAQAAELTPDDWTLWDRAGWSYLEAAKDADALKAFEAARKTAPPGIPVPGGLLVTRYLLGHKSAAAELLKAMTPETELARALAAVEKGLAAKPGSADHNFGLGYLFTRVLGFSERGLGPLEAVVKADPKHAEAWLLLSDLNRALGRDAQANAAGAKYVELQPEAPDAYRLRAQRYVELKREGQAAAQYEEGIKKHPEAAELYFALARLYERGGADRKAEETYRRLVAAAEERKLEPLQAAARAQLANHFARQRNYAEAEKLYREAAAQPRASVAAQQTWGALLSLTGKWEEAASALSAAAARDAKERGPSGARDALLTSRYRAAAAWLAAGNREAARSALVAALAEKGNGRTGPQAEAEAFLAWLDRQPAAPYALGDERWAAFTWRRPVPEGQQEVRGRFYPAAAGWRATLQQIQKAFPDAWPADYALAREYATGGYTKEALRLLDRVSRVRPDWWAPHFAAGQYYARERDKENGIPALRTVLRLAPECRQAHSFLSLLTRVREKDAEAEE